MSVRHGDNRRGFNLIEAAIVLGVVGLVVAGIWEAAAWVKRSQTINNTAASAVYISGAARRVFDRYSYPTSGKTYPIETAIAAGVFPTDFTHDPSWTWYARSPMGIYMFIFLDCSTGDQCPRLRVGFFGPSPLYSDPNTMTPSMCVEIIRRFAGQAKDHSDFMGLQLWTGGDGGLPVNIYHYPPFDPTQVVCAPEVRYVTFWFRG